MILVARIGTTIACLCVMLGFATAAHAAPCVPSVYGHGPTVTIEPDYNDPTRSEVYYDSSDVLIGIDPCFP